MGNKASRHDDENKGKAKKNIASLPETDNYDSKKGVFVTEHAPVTVVAAGPVSPSKKDGELEDPFHIDFPMECDGEGVDNYFDYYDNVQEEEPEDEEEGEGEGEGEEDEAASPEGDVTISTEEKHKCGIEWPKGKFKGNKKNNKERNKILKEAKRLGEALSPEEKNRNIVVIYNPVSGAGAAKRLVQHMVVPILKLTGLKFTIVETQYRRHAVEYMQTLDLDSVDGVIISGGDGLVHEVVTGYFLHPNQERMRLVPIGICPSGTANAMAHALHTHPSKTHVSLVGRAALAVAKGKKRQVDVFNVISEKEKIFALSCFGWGLAGAVALKADKLRWIPGQKRARYDIAGAVTMLRDWPVIDRAVLEYPEMERGVEVWRKENIGAVNMIATNLPFLGDDHPIHPNIGPDDGHVALVVVDESCSRMDVVKLAMDMKKGIYLSEDKKRCKAFRMKEFKLTPTEGRSPYNIDGDPHTACPVHVKVMHKALTVFVLPEAGDKSINSKIMNAPTALGLSIAGINASDLRAPQQVAVPKDGALSALGGMLGVGGGFFPGASPK